ncbi:hypothetical protein QAD02_004217 [Eretmocerus hayati]|uniref:Uncharacterized protein n=1 Tax=Eretmocerus hayati TaxID=131215 RepID=A0ACC2NQR4_9HYME|nr:hypothetical protein QAD02_004217 [Eretmocerus hayati]
MSNTKSDTDEMSSTDSTESCKGFVFSWPCVFTNFSSLPNRVGELSLSSKIIVGNYEFQIQVYPGGKTEDVKDYISIYLHLIKPSKLNMKYALSILLGNEKCLHRIGTKHNDFDVERGDTTYGWRKFVERSYVTDTILASTNDQLIILLEFFDSVLPLCPYQTKKLCGYEKYVNNERLSDIKIIVGDHTIYAHKILLGSENEVFMAMFSHDVRENKENIIEIEDIDFDTMIELIRFIYVGHVRDIEKRPKELLIAADKYGVDELKIHCEKFLSQLFSIHNVLEYLQFADQYKAHHMKIEALTFLSIHKKDIANKSEIKEQLALIHQDLDLTAQVVTTLCNS